MIPSRNTGIQPEGQIEIGPRGYIEEKSYTLIHMYVYGWMCLERGTQISLLDINSITVTWMVTHSRKLRKWKNRESKLRFIFWVSSNHVEVNNPLIYGSPGLRFTLEMHSPRSWDNSSGVRMNALHMQEPELKSYNQTYPSTNW